LVVRSMLTAMQGLVTSSGCYTDMLIKGYIKSIAHRNERSVMNEKHEALIVLQRGQVIKYSED
jgi:hypothetical protein